MARATRLKVYRTPIGFHDAYVAASSQKAALAAWGSAHDLFATGEADLVTDPELTKAPLAKPGEIVRQVRGTVAEHIAALPAEIMAPPPGQRKQPPATPKREPPLKAKPAARAANKPEPILRKPKPSRGAVEAAKAALADALEQQQRERSAIAQREQELRCKRRTLGESHKASAASLRQAIKTAESAYADAIVEWRKASAGLQSGKA